VTVHSPAQLAGHGPGHSDTVLVVDDAPDSLRLIRTALERAEITVLVATSGKAALELLQHIVPDLILMDALMPGMDGFETTARIKASGELAHIPVVFMTGLSEGEHVVRAFAAGGVDYVRKPVDLAELLARVRTHMSQGRAVHASVASLDATGRMVVSTDSAGKLLWCTPLAERAIKRLAPAWTGKEPALPSPLRETVERLLATRKHAGGASRVEGEWGALEVAIIARYRDDEVLVRLVEQNPHEDVPRLQSRLLLTAREAEVLLWLSYGKSNADISEVLKISPRTVQKHLERIYEKLGVETRSAASAIALRVTGK
jgi:DNA-binding NarL/FixJ family response regulator